MALHAYEPIGDGDEDHEAYRFKFFDQNKLLWASLDQNGKRIKTIAGLQVLLALLWILTGEW